MSDPVLRRAAALGILPALLIALHPADAPARPSGEATRAAAATDDPRIDHETGEELVNDPPPRHFDHLHVKIELDIPDMSSPQLRGVATLDLAPIGTSRQTLVLNAQALRIESVQVAVPAGAVPRDARFAHDGERLTITLPEPVPPGQKITVVTAYSGDYSKTSTYGLVWTQGNPEAESPTDLVPQIHTQGQPEHNRLWFPCHDFPNERATTELIVTVEDGFVVGSNGRLMGTGLGAPGAGGRARTRWHWLQAQPHPAYLVTMVVGKFAIVGLPQREGVPVPTNVRGEPISMYLLTPLGTEKTAAAVYAKTPAMMDFFAEYFDEPYPWDKYSQAIVRRFAFGGMENTSATTMTGSTARGRPGQFDDLIAHELAHQWTGNLVTCKSWEHAWLNEGWASYAEALWDEHEAGPDPEAARRAYQRRIARFVGAQRGLNRTYAPIFPPLASPRYDAPLDVFTKPNDIYSKGAVVLHMLRMKLGDETFLRATRLYIDRFKFKEVETDDFRHVLEEVSGRSLERFFTQWCLRPGLPRLAAELEWTDAPSPGPREGGGTLTLRIEQTQRIDDRNPAFAFDLPIRLRFPAGVEPRTVTMAIDARQHVASFELPAKPSDVVFDPMLSVAAPTNVRKPLAMWREQLGDESVFARLQAIEHLSSIDEPGDEPGARALIAEALADPHTRELVAALDLLIPAQGAVAARP